MVKDILLRFGFEEKDPETLWWGVGSLVWGHEITIRCLEDDFYEIKHHQWEYNSDGDCVRDDTFKDVLHGKDLIQYIIDNTPDRYR